MNFFAEIMTNGGSQLLAVIGVLVVSIKYINSRLDKIERKIGKLEDRIFNLVKEWKDEK